MPQFVKRGVGSFGELPELLAEQGVKRLLVVHGRNSTASSGAESTINAIRGCEVARFNEVEPNPEAAGVGRCAETLKSFAPDVVIAVGGGSAIDTAKGAIALSSGAPESEVLANRFDPSSVESRLWAAPTTAGSGSEATHFAVLYKENRKYSIAHSRLKPETVFLDPSLTYSCPRGLTLASALDAVCQAVESYWSRGSNPESRALAIQALPPLLTNVFRALEEPRNPDVRSEMLYAAHTAGKAIDISKTTAGHAMSYGLTGRYGLAHGIAVIAAMGPLVETMDRKYGYFTPRTELDASFAAFGPSFPAAFREFRKRAFTYLAPDILSVASKENTPERAHAVIASLVAGVNVDRLSNHPISLSVDDIADIYGRALASLGSAQMGSVTRS